MTEQSREWFNNCSLVHNINKGIVHDLLLILLAVNYASAKSSNHGTSARSSSQSLLINYGLATVIIVQYS